MPYLTPRRLALVAACLAAALPAYAQNNPTTATTTAAAKPVTVNGVEVLSGGMDSETAFDGQGDSSQSNKLSGEITVTVAQRLANGNLLIRGQKWIAINQGKEYVRVQGIVRPIDIDPDNSISSLKVADAMISYGGKGALTVTENPGGGTRVTVTVPYRTIEETAA